MSDQTEQTQLLGISADPVDNEQVPLVRQGSSSNGDDDGSRAQSPPLNASGGGGGEEEDEEEEESLEDYAEMVITILQPVAITMLLVVWIVRVLNASNIVIVSGDAIYQVYNEEETDGTATKLFGSLLNALLFLAIIIGVTVLFVILYKYRCLKVIYAWLIVSTGMLLAVFGGYLFQMILEAENLPLDYISFSVILWNFLVVGIMSSTNIFWYAPQKVTQGYLIVISALMAVWFTRLPEWTTWSILAVVAIYDLFAVLCPKGPLKVLVETAQERKEPIPALLYNASVVIMMAEPSSRVKTQFTIADDEEEEEPAPPRRGRRLEEGHDNRNINTDNDENNNNNNNGAIISDGNANPTDNVTNPNPPVEEKKGVKLGLGDFVFYSVLMGRAALFDVVTVFTCFIGIITGLFMTLLLLAMFRKALPALPVSTTLRITH